VRQGGAGGQVRRNDFGTCRAGVAVGVCCGSGEMLF